MFKRMIHFITYHISEYVLASSSSESEGNSTQKYRTQMARSMLQEGWA